MRIQMSQINRKIVTKICIVMTDSAKNTTHAIMLVKEAQMSTPAAAAAQLALAVVVQP